VSDVEKWGTLLEIVRWHRDVSTVEKFGMPLETCFQPNRVAAVSHEQRNDGRGFRKDFQQSCQNSNYRNDRAGSDVNELECGSMPNVMVALANIGGALCSTPQSLAAVPCWSTVQ